MKSYPLKSISIQQAMDKQFQLVDEISKEFTGYELLDLGDLGVHKNGNIPQTTEKVERVIAKFFKAESACLVRGAGTGAIREAISAIVNTHKEILVHTSPIYSTTITSLDILGIETKTVDFNDMEAVNKVSSLYPNVKVALVQFTRQSLEDSYDIKSVITSLKNQGFTVITDDNYAVMKVEEIGSELGADISTFSLFKLLGPVGIGCIVGKKSIIDAVKKFHYSGGSQVQGYESLECLRGLVYAPVSLAIQAKQTESILQALLNHEVEGVKNAFIANAQSKVILVELDQPIAQEVLKEAEELGALPHPVGSESKYEITPLFYKVSGTMLKEDQSRLNYWIRINPMRSGKDTVLRILSESIKKVK